MTTTVNSDWAWDHAISTYQLYPGGPTYTVGQLSTTVQDTTLEPDAATNPLGIFYTSGDCNLGDNVNITGTIIANDDIHVSGVNVVLAPFELSPLEGTTSTIQLPLALTRDDFRVKSSASLTTSGLINAWDRFEVEAGNETVSMEHTGHVTCNECMISHRWQWNLGSTLWWIHHFVFLSQMNDNGGIQYFPVYLGYAGRNPDPTIKLRTPAEEPTYAWLQRNVPLYAVHPSDDGLRFELIDWIDSPE